MVSRLLVVLPKRWFGEQNPNLSALVKSIATPWSWLYLLVQYVIAQTRLETASDDWLDLIAYDYFGAVLARSSGESDVAFRGRIRTALMREAATRPAVSVGLETSIGIRPNIFEPANCNDTGAYGGLSEGPIVPCLGFAYGVAGGWGNLSLPLQFFITVARPATPGIGLLAGYGSPFGGYGIGAISYVDLSLLIGTVTDAEIQINLCSLLPVNTRAWLRIT